MGVSWQGAARNNGHQVIGLLGHQVRRLLGNQVIRLLDNQVIVRDGKSLQNSTGTILSLKNCHTKYEQKNLRIVQK